VAVFEIIGTAGALIICASAIPQVVKTYRLKRSRDLSIVYLSVLMLGMGLLQSYSVYVRDFVFIFGNTLSMFSTGLLIVLWVKYEARGKDNNKDLISHKPTQTHTDLFHRRDAEDAEFLTSFCPVFTCTPNALVPKASGVELNTHPCGRLSLCLKRAARWN